MNKAKIGERFKPEKYSMMFCPKCNGSGRSFADANVLNVCNICGGFGLIKKEESKAFRIKDDLVYRLGEFPLEQT